ncbi:MULTISPECIES: hypothetical protein [Belliella]|uniref:Uncharacterized protein n=2 Tax=Belliella TaxID=232244 RepID=A0A1N7PML3_9BACT|nr:MULTISPECIES: hypothetical protein [Belliella]MCH7415253.1 hypothetical protein [Belliella alkalica]SIT11770.1 hypothetical protein SAMN05421761_11811 [Belliella pelovolcani]
MKNKQTSLLLALAKKLKKETSTKELAIKSLSSAGIVTKNGKLTKSFPNLNRVFSVSE